MFGNKNILVIWIAARQLVILGGKLTAPQSIVFPENVVSNLEIIDRDELYALVKTWTAAHPHSEAEIVWIFGHDTFFEHVMQTNEKEEWDTVVVRFLDLLPFEETDSRVYTTAAGTKVVAINKDLFTALKQAFALQGIATRAEIAASDLGTLSSAQTLTPQVATYVMKNLDTIQKNRLDGDDMTPDAVVPNPSTPTKKKSSLPLLIGVFAVLLGILGYLLVTMNR